MSDKRKPNNVDHALTPKPEPDEWDDTEELTEDTGKVSKLLVDRKPEAHYAAAYELGAALREQRRRHRVESEHGEEPPSPTGSSPVRVAHCSDCGKYVTAEGSHFCKTDPDHQYWRVVGYPDSFVTDEFESKIQEIDDRTKSTYERLEKLQRRLTRGVRNGADIEPEWREPPGYPNYLMHSVTRELWRRAYESHCPKVGFAVTRRNG